MNKLHQSILSLKQGVTTYGPAPHKPILLLAVIDLFESRDIKDNWIEPSEELVVRFQSIWTALVTSRHTPTFALPFFHLKNEKGGFWELITLPGREIPVTKSKSIKSFRALTETVAAARLSEALFIALSNSVEREMIKQAILNRYFPQHKLYDVRKYEASIKKDMVYDASENYVRKVKRKLDEIPKELQEQEIVVRSHIFRKAILDIYDNRCSVSGLKVEFRGKASLIDACHIQPFAESFDDTIRNGIALSTHLHRAFDRGMIAISDDYTVLLHKQVKDLSSNYSIIQFENKHIKLPDKPDYYPDLSRLKEHRKRFGF